MRANLVLIKYINKLIINTRLKTRDKLNKIFLPSISNAMTICLKMAEPMLKLYNVIPIK